MRAKDGVLETGTREEKDEKKRNLKKEEVERASMKKFWTGTNRTHVYEYC